MSIMKNIILTIVSVAASLFATSCADHDDPKLAPIDTSKVKISAEITVEPSVQWLSRSEELTVKVSGVSLSAPKGVILRNIKLVCNDGTMRQKPYSGEPLEFKLPLDFMRGRINIAVWGDLVQKNSRDAEIIIADNIQRIVFSETPKFECEATVDITVKSRSTSGEEYSHSFQVKSIDSSTIAIPQSELYWTPQSGTASALDVTLTASAKSFSTNSTLESAVTRVYWSGESGRNTITVSIPNTPGSLIRAVPGLIVDTSQFGTWENVTVNESTLIYSFGITETN